MIEQPPEQIRFVVDENFPETIVPFVELHVPQVELVLWKQVDPRLESLEDDRLILALYQSGYGSLVTLNYRMLNFLNVLARIMVMTARMAGTRCSIDVVLVSFIVLTLYFFASCVTAMHEVWASNPLGSASVLRDARSAVSDTQPG